MYRTDMYIENDYGQGMGKCNWGTRFYMVYDMNNSVILALYEIIIDFKIVEISFLSLLSLETLKLVAHSFVGVCCTTQCC